MTKRDASPNIGRHKLYTLRETGQAEMYSHEANGHALMYVNTRDRKMSAHPADKKNLPLINMILKSKSETVINMKSR
jgi:hypothetical protein